MKKINLNEEFSLEGYVWMFIKNGESISLKKLRETKTKVTSKSSFQPPTIEMFKDYFEQNGYSKIVAERAWKGYHVADWHKSNGDPVLNWKQTCIQVWFKPENLEKKNDQTNKMVR